MPVKRRIRHICSKNKAISRSRGAGTDRAQDKLKSVYTINF
jgi:hypothetical protein